MRLADLVNFHANTQYREKFVIDNEGPGLDPSGGRGGYFAFCHLPGTGIAITPVRVVIAGGRSSRMVAATKALLPLKQGWLRQFVVEYVRFERSDLRNINTPEDLAAACAAGL